ncbi:MAG: sugar phosphate isomerase/epimerase family protein [Kiritimatiellia bacterium]|jgi:sugar phosphate isomerase/epimerase|nr:sugar phosphate isomerase/epimerase family protein [Kiritimatiellia bacterium]
MQLTRKDFTRSVTAFGALGGLGMMRAGKPEPHFLFGICAGPDKAERLKAIGYDFIEGGVAGTLKPAMPDAAFAPECAKLKTCALPFRSCNGFIPREFRLTGPAADHGPALEYAAKACERADALGIPFIVLGSGGARNVPEGFSTAEGKAQFIAFCRKLGDRIRDRNVTIVLEPLNKNESNILNSVTEGIAYVDEINRPRIRLLADFYHMMKEKEGPDAIRKAGDRIRHCHIAELEGRKAPGTRDEDLSGYFMALRDIGYTGGVSCECGWPKENIENAWEKALATMRRQAGLS